MIRTLKRILLLSLTATLLLANSAAAAKTAPGAPEIGGRASVVLPRASLGSFSALPRMGEFGMPLTPALLAADANPRVAQEGAPTSASAPTAVREVSVRITTVEKQTSNSTLTRLDRALSDRVPLNLIFDAAQARKPDEDLAPLVSMSSNLGDGPSRGTGLGAGRSDSSVRRDGGDSSGPGDVEPPVGGTSASDGEGGYSHDPFITRVYHWMSWGLGTTALVSIGLRLTGLAFALTHAPLLMLGLFLAELGMVFFLASRVSRLSAGTAKAIFFAYAALNGVTLSPFLSRFTGGSVAAAFLVTAGMFGGIALYGHKTKRDLSSWGSYALMALWGIILASLANFFIRSWGFASLLTYASVAVFVALTAYHTNKIKAMAEEQRQASPETETSAKVAIVGALMLYLDFLNLFNNLLRIIGRRSNLTALKELFTKQG